MVKILYKKLNGSKNSVKKVSSTYLGHDPFSHGEAYMHIMNEMVNRRGIYLLDEPEASLSPSKQLAFIYFLQNHLQNFNSQFIIATHSPMLMAYPDATIYEITGTEI